MGRGRLWLVTVLLFVILFGCSAFAASIVGHGFVTTLSELYVERGKAMGYVDIRNSSGAPEVISVAANFFDDDGCVDDVLAQWPRTTVTIGPGETVRVLFRIVYISEEALQNAHGDLVYGRDSRLTYKYSVHTSKSAVEGEAVVASGDTFRSTQVGYTLADSLRTVRGFGVIPEVDIDGDIAPGYGYVCDPTLLGTFQTTIDVDPNAAWDLGFASTLMIDYRHDVGQIRSVSTFGDAGWTDQIFAASIPIGAMTIRSEADFDPNAAALDDAFIELTINIAGATLTGTVYTTPEGSGMTGRMEGQSAAGLAYDALLRFNVDKYGNVIQTGCYNAFTSAEIQLGAFSFDCCPEQYIMATLFLTDAGFDKLELDFDAIEIPSIPWVRLYGQLEYALDEKTLEIGFVPMMHERVDCLRFVMELTTTNVQQIEFIRPRMILMECNLEHFAITAENYFGNYTTRGRTMTRYINSTLMDDYYEVYRLWSIDQACCGDIEFEMGFYFLEGGIALFDLAGMQLLAAIDLTFNLKVGVGLEFDFEQPVGDQWVYGDFYFEYRW